MPETTATPPTPQEALLDRLQGLVQRAEQGDESAMPELRAALDVNPHLWQRYGDLGAQAQAAWLQLVAGPNLLLREAVGRKVEELKAELGGGSTSPLERLLVERAAATWMHVCYCDALAAQAKGASEAQSRVMERQRDAAHRRHLTALKALATVRKLLTPAPSPVEVATRLDRTGVPSRRHREGIAGAVPASN
jgi:hypothetical protein